MEALYYILKSFVDPIFILFIFLFISLAISLQTVRKKTDSLFLLLTIILLYTFSIQPVASFLSWQLEKKYIKIKTSEEKKKLEVIVVLGGGISSARGTGHLFPSDTTAARLAHAVRMYQKHNAKLLVCSGKGEQKISEADFMAQMANDFGIPREKIRPEAKSQNTYQHAIEFDKMFSDKNIHIGLVTSACHMKRSETEFRKYFKNIHPLPAGYLSARPTRTPVLRYLPQSEWLSNNAIIFKEYLGQIWYWSKDI